MTKSSSAPGAGLLTTLVATMGVTTLLAFGLGSIGDIIITDLKISETQFGLLASVGYGCAALGSLSLGRFSDKRSDISLTVIIFTAAGGSLLLLSLPGGYAVLLAAAACGGISQSFSNGVTNRILAQRVPTNKRVSWVGFKQSGVQVSQLMVGVSFPILSTFFGWRGATFAVGIAVLAMGTYAILKLASTPTLGVNYTERQSVHQAEHTKTQPRRIPHRYLVATMALFGLISGIGQQAINMYLPLFAVRELNQSLVVGGMTVALTGVMGVLARIGLARIMSKGYPMAKLLTLLSSIAVLSASGLLAATVSHSPLLMWIAVGLHGSSSLGVSVVLMSGLLRIAPAAKMGSATGLVTGFQYVGYMIGPALMGWLLSTPSGFIAGWLAVIAIFLCCVGLGLSLLAVFESDGR